MSYDVTVRDSLYLSNSNLYPVSLVPVLLYLFPDDPVRAVDCPVVAG